MTPARMCSRRATAALVLLSSCTTYVSPYAQGPGLAWTRPGPGQGGLPTSRFVRCPAQCPRGACVSKSQPSVGEIRAWAQVSAAGLSLRARRGSVEAGKSQEFDKSVLTYKGHRWPREMFQFIVQDIGVPRDRISHVAEASQVMSLNVTSNLQPKLEYFVGELGIPRKSLGRVIGSFPQLLTLNLESNLIPKLRFLSEELGIPEKDVGKVITRHPQLLGLSLEHNLRPTAAFLLEEALVPIGKLPNLILRYPSVLSLSVDGNLRPTVEYLRDNLGMDGIGLGRAIGMNPMLLTLSLEKTMVKTISFYKTELRIHKSTLAQMARKYPALLTFNIENNVKPKIELLVKGMGLPLSKATRIIVAYPSVLGRSKYSLLSSYNGLLAAGYEPKEVSTV